MVKDSPSMDRSQARSMVITEGRHRRHQPDPRIASRRAGRSRAADRPSTPPSPPTPCSSVVEPMMCGLGGDLFAIHRDGQIRQAHRHQRQRSRTQAHSTLDDAELLDAHRPAFTVSRCRARWTAGPSCTRNSANSPGAICSRPRSITPNAVSRHRNHPIRLAALRAHPRRSERRAPVPARMAARRA